MVLKKIGFLFTDDDLKADQVSKGPPCEGKHITNITKIDEEPVRR